MAEAWRVRTSVTRVLKSPSAAESMTPPRSLARDFWSDPRWSMAAAAMTPRASETALRPASFPGVGFMGQESPGRGADGLLVPILQKRGRSRCKAVIYPEALEGVRVFLLGTGV